MERKNADIKETVIIDMIIDDAKQINKKINYTYEEKYKEMEKSLKIENQKIDNSGKLQQRIEDLENDAASECQSNQVPMHPSAPETECTTTECPGAEVHFFPKCPVAI